MGKHGRHDVEEALTGDTTTTGAIPSQSAIKEIASQLGQDLDINHNRGLGGNRGGSVTYYKAKNLAEWKQATAPLQAAFNSIYTSPAAGLMYKHDNLKASQLPRRG